MSCLSRFALLTGVLALFSLAAPAPVAAQHTHGHSHVHERAISFPDVPGFATLACDFHIHTVFSDGTVWPTVRVQEAQRDGLDAIAITDHLEYQPHADDIPNPDRNRSYDLAAAAAGNSDLIVLRGSEVTRSMPPGHVNAIFLRDTNPLLQDDVMAVFREVQAQGGFTFWNHPNWTAQRPDGMATLTDMHRQLIRDDLLHGIEVANDLTYSDEALQIALDYDLTIIGTSDIHGLVDWQYEVPEGGHRPVTLVFAEERSAAGIQEALLAGRTAVWYRNLLIGREAHVIPLLEASLRVTGAQYLDDTAVLRVTLDNRSDAEFLLHNTTDLTFHGTADLVRIPPNSTHTLDVKTVDRRAAVDLTFEVLNAVVAPNTHPVLTLPVRPADE